MSLPAEIWLHITQYLPMDTIADLYSVNSALFHLSMDARYRDIIFDEINGSTAYRLERLRKPEIASRVRSFHLAPHIIQQQFDEEPSDVPKSQFRKFTRRLFGSTKQQKQNIIQEITRGLQIDEELTHIIPLLVNVQTFSLSWGSSQDFSAPYVDVAWRSLSQNLTKFDLTITTSKAVTLFPLPVTFPRLEAFKIHMLGGNSVEACEDVLGSFINTLHATLKQLTVRSTPSRSLANLYLKLDYFHNLSSIDVDISSARGNALGYATFIDQQSKVVHDLALYLPSDYWMIWSPPPQLGLGDIRLPKLEKVLLSDAVIVSFWDHVLRFLKSHLKTLTDFSTDGCGLTHGSNLSSFLDVFNHTNPYSTLTCLSFYVVQLDAKLLDSLAKALFRLDRLTLWITVVSQTIVPSEDYPQGSNHGGAFLRGFRSCQSLKSWKLTDITIKRRSCCGEYILWGIMRTCATFIPSITSFMGNGDTDIPIPTNKPPKHVSAKGSNEVCRYRS